MNRDLQCIAEHTVDLSLLRPGALILDLGSREGNWSKAMQQYSFYNIKRVDADPSTDAYHYAVSSQDGLLIDFITYGNGTGNYIDDGRKLPENHSRHKVETRRIDTLVRELFDKERIDLIKIDIEGEEVPALLALTEAPAEQLSIEFHLHTGTPHWQVLAVIAHLRELGYEYVHSDYSDKHGSGLNYWNELFVLRDNNAYLQKDIDLFKRSVGNYK